MVAAGAGRLAALPEDAFALTDRAVYIAALFQPEVRPASPYAWRTQQCRVVSVQVGQSGACP